MKTFYKKKQHILIIGPPGSGKKSLLQTWLTIKSRKPIRYTVINNIAKYQDLEKIHFSQVIIVFAIDHCINDKANILRQNLRDLIFSLPKKIAQRPVKIIITHLDKISGFYEYYNDLSNTDRHSAVIKIATKSISASFTQWIEQTRHATSSKMQRANSPKERLLIHNFPDQMEFISKPIIQLVTDINSLLNKKSHHLYFCANRQCQKPVDPLAKQYQQQHQLHSTIISSPIQSTQNTFSAGIATDLFKKKRVGLSFLLLLLITSGILYSMLIFMRDDTLIRHRTARKNWSQQAAMFKHDLPVYFWLIPAWLMSHHLEQLNLLSSHQTINRHWQRTIIDYYAKHLQPYYPFNKQSQHALSLQSINAFIGNNGRINHFLKQHNAPNIQKTAIRKQLNTLHHDYYRGNNTTPKLTLTMTTNLLTDNIAKLSFTHCNSNISYSHGPIQSHRLYWHPNCRHPGVTITFYDFSNRKHTIHYPGTFGLQKWLQSGRITPINHHQWRVFWQVGNYRYGFLIKSKATLDVLLLKPFQKFTLTKEIIHV